MENAVNEKVNGELTWEDPDFLKWLGCTADDYAKETAKLDRLEKKKGFSHTHKMEFEWAVDGFHAEFDDPFQTYKENKWASYEEYMAWKKANPEPSTPEQLALKAYSRLMERTYLNYEAFRTMSPAYKEAFWCMLGYESPYHTEYRLPVSEMSDEVREAWEDVVHRRTEWAKDNNQEFSIEA